MAKAQSHSYTSKNTGLSYRSELRKNFLQLLVLTVGGSVVSFVFQSFAQIRDENLQQQKFQRETFLALRQETNRTITERLLAMERIKLRIRSDDFAGAETLRVTRYEEAVHNWNLNVFRLQGLVLRFDGCGSDRSSKCEQSR